MIRFQCPGIRQAGRLGGIALRVAVLAAVFVAGAAAPGAPPAPDSGGDGQRVSAEKAASGAAESKRNPCIWDGRTRSVAVFKDGLGFFMRQGDVRLREGWCMAAEIPPAAFGTLAIYALDDETVVDVVGSGPGQIVEFDGRDVPDDLTTRRERLEAGRGIQVEVHYEHKGRERSAAGKIVSVGPEFVILDDGTNSLAVPIPGVKRMQILELPLRIHLARDDDRVPDRAELGMAYLRKGITWIPDYSLEILDDQTARLTLRGTLVNQAEDLVHTDVHLVVGVPHFVHTEYLAPIAVGQVIRALGTGMAAEGAVPDAVRSQIVSRAAIVSNAQTAPQFDAAARVVESPVAQDPGGLDRALGNLPQLGGAAATDYTVYTKQDLTLRRGEKAILTLFTKTIRYAHVYRWTPPERMTHALLLQNTTDTPWTTGPCLALSGDRPLSEDLLHYTPKGAKCELPVTTAINVAHDKAEREVDRQLKAHSPRHDVHYDLVTLEGKLKLRNFETRDVRVVVTNPVPGKPIGADRDGAIAIDSTQLKLIERSGTLSWTVDLKPGEETTLTYRYERYVLSH